MTAKQTQRPKFFENQYLGAADLSAAVNYARYQDARHALGAHTWGIATGLQLTEKPSPAGNNQVDVFIQPGYAWDGFGRPLVVLAPYKIPSELFKGLVYDAAIDAGSPAGRLVKVWIRYVESAAQPPAAGFEVCDPEDQTARVDEFFRVEVGDFATSDQRTPISLAGKQVDASAALQAFNPSDPLLYDASVPHQTFPEEGQSARWLIPLGVVRWKPPQTAGQTGNFVQRDANANDLEASNSLRLQAGVVSGAVQAVDGFIRLRSRTNNYSAVRSPDLVWVEGDLRVEGKVRMFGRYLEFLDLLGKDNSVPLTVNRLEDDGAGGKQLQVRLGVAEAGLHKFAVGPFVANSFKPKFVVLDRGEVGIGTATPNRALTVQGSGNTYLNVKANGGAQEVLLGADAAGGIVSTMTNHDLVLRAGTNSTKVWIKASGDVGIGTDTPLNTLHVARGSHLNAIFDRTDTSDHLTVVVGSVGSGFRFSDSNFFFIGKEPYANRNSLSTGTDLLRITAAGDVGIGTTTPQGKLDVNGRILRNGSAFSLAGNVNDNDIVAVPWGTVNDWVIFVAPREMGQEEPDSEFDNALLLIRCLATVISGTSWQITARYKFKFSNGDDTGNGLWFGGQANYILVPQ